MNEIQLQAERTRNRDESIIRMVQVKIADSIAAVIGRKCQSGVEAHRRLASTVCRRVVRCHGRHATRKHYLKWKRETLPLLHEMERLSHALSDPGLFDAVVNSEASAILEAASYEQYLEDRVEAQFYKAKALRKIERALEKLVD